MAERVALASGNAMALPGMPKVYPLSIGLAILQERYGLSDDVIARFKAEHADRTVRIGEVSVGESWDDFRANASRGQHACLVVFNRELRLIEPKCEVPAHERTAPTDQDLAWLQLAQVAAAWTAPSEDRSGYSHGILPPSGAPSFMRVLRDLPRDILHSLQTAVGWLNPIG